MEKRVDASPMDWEYQDRGPMDPSSPFTQNVRRAQERRHVFGEPSGFRAFNQNPFANIPPSSSKPLPPTPMMPQHPSSFFHNSRAQSTATAPPFRNAAFTTPRKPFNIDAISADQSPAELSPAVTDASDFPETPDPDQSNASLDIDHMTITSAMMNGRRPPSPKKASGKGDICKTLFPTRDKVRKRRRHNGDKDISGYRLPYIYAGEGDDSDYESDDSTSEPKRPISPKKSKRGGWFGGFLSSLHQHPYLPSILGYWLNFCFSFFCVGGTLWILWAIVAGLREDFAAAQSLVREELLDEMAKCRSDYINNKCTPVSERLPAMFQLCEQWFTCMNRNPDHLKKVQLGAKSIVEVLNEIVDTMSYKTISLLLLLFAIFVFSGRSLYKTASDFPDFTRYGPTPPPSAYGQPAANEHALPPQVYWQAIQPQTPHYNMRRLQANDETPETDTSPPRARAFKALLPPETPGGRKSPSKAERARSRSPTKPRSPAKMY